MKKTNIASLFIIVFLAFSIGAAYAVDTCNILNSSLTLANDVSATGNCFVFNANNIALDCAGFTVNYASVTSGIGIDANNLFGVNITNCVIKANNVNTTSNYGIRFLRTNSSIALSNTIFTNGSSGTDAIRIDTKANYNIIANNTISTQSNTSLGIGVSVQTSSVGNNITGNIINTQGNTTTNYGIYLTSMANNSYIADNVIITNGTSNNYGIYLFTKVFNNTLTNNTISTNGTSSSNYGIHLSTDTAYNTVSYNTIKTNGTSSNYGIYLVTRNYNNTILYNNISSFGRTGGSNNGIYIQTVGSTNNITGNQVNTTGGGNSNYGIILQTQINYTYVSNNIISTGLDDSTTSYGIHLLTDTYSNTLYGNTIQTNSTSSNNHGIFLSTRAYNNIISNNIILSNGSTSSGPTDGILLQTTIYGNNITGNVINVSGLSVNAIIKTTQVNNTYIFNNTINAKGSSTDIGIAFTTQIYNNTISNNTILTNGTGSSNFGISINTNTVANNTISYNSIETDGSSNNPGIRLNGMGDGNVNIFDNNNITTQSALSNAIQIQTSNSTIFNNTLLNNPVSWIKINDMASNATFINTTFLSLDGSINFNGSFWIDKTETITIAKLNVTYNRTYLNTTNLTYLNTTAIISLFGITGLTNPQVVYNTTDDYEAMNFSACPSQKCTMVSYINNIAMFVVNGFTNYAVNQSDPGTLSINFTTPSGVYTDLVLNYAVNATATIYCRTNSCGTVSWLLLTNDSTGNPEYLVNMTTILRNLTEQANLSCGFMNTNSYCMNSIKVTITEASFTGFRRPVMVSAISTDPTSTWSNSTIKWVVGIYGKLLVAQAYTGKIYDTGENASVIVVVKDASGNSVDAIVNVTVLNPDGTTAFFAQAVYVDKGRYNATFYLPSSFLNGTYRVFINATDGTYIAYADTAFSLRPKLSVQQNETLYNISSIALDLNRTLLNDSNFGNYSIEKILLELNATKNVLLSLLQRQEDFTNEEIFLITDSVVTINEIMSSLQSGEMSGSQAQESLAQINSKVAAITGKASSGKTYPIINVNIVIITAALAITAIIIHKEKQKSAKKQKSKVAKHEKSLKFFVEKVLGRLNGPGMNTDNVQTHSKASAASTKQPVDRDQVDVSKNNDYIKVTVGTVEKIKTIHMQRLHNLIVKKQIKENRQKLDENYKAFKSGSLSKEEYEDSRAVILKEIGSMKNLNNVPS